MKKLLCLFLALVIVAGVVGCGGTPAVDASPDSPSPSLSPSLSPASSFSPSSTMSVSPSASPSDTQVSPSPSPSATPDYSPFSIQNLITKFNSAKKPGTGDMYNLDISDAEIDDGESFPGDTDIFYIFDKGSYEVVLVENRDTGLFDGLFIDLFSKDDVTLEETNTYFIFFLMILEPNEYVNIDNDLSKQNDKIVRISEGEHWTVNWQGGLININPINDG